MKSVSAVFAAALIAAPIGTGSAYADACSGHSHTRATVLGAGGGALVGGLATHSLAGAVIGGVGGGLLGNAIGRSNDCRHYRHRYYRTDREGHRHYYYR